MKRADGEEIDTDAAEFTRGSESSVDRRQPARSSGQRLLADEHKVSTL